MSECDPFHERELDLMRASDPSDAVYLCEGCFMAEEECECDE